MTTTSMLALRSSRCPVPFHFNSVVDCDNEFIRRCLRDRETIVTQEIRQVWSSGRRDNTLRCVYVDLIMLVHRGSPSPPFILVKEGTEITWTLPSWFPYPNRVGFYTYHFLVYKATPYPHTPRNKINFDLMYRAPHSSRAI